MYPCLNGVTAGGGLPVDQFVAIAADAGWPGADVDVSYGVKNGASKLRDIFAARSLKFGGWGVGDWRNDETKWKDCLTALKANAKVAAELKIDSCCTWLLPTSDMPLIENWNFHVTRLKPVAQALGEFGLRFGLEFVAPYHLRVLKKHEFVFSPGQMLELAAAIGPNVGLLVDAFHVRAAGVGMDAVSKIPADKVVLGHLNDCQDIPPYQLKDGERLLPGEGLGIASGFIKALKQTGYNGPVSVEVFSADLKKMPPAEAAAKAWTATKKAWDAAGV